jgi:tetratricopeptide (TPR) repeat protein
MEKNRILDASRKAVSTALLVLALCAFLSCTLPKIAILHDPLTPEEHINLGVSYEKKGELDAALEQYQAASKKLAVAHLYTGNIYFQKNDATSAEQAYIRAIEKTNDARAYNNLAWLYYTRGERLQEAERLARTAVALSPEAGDFRDTLEKIIERRSSAREGR